MAELFYDYWWLVFPMAGLAIGFIELVAPVSASAPHWREGK